MASAVSVIGLGLMGSSLCRAFLRAKHRVTAWNRTPAKAEPLGKEGAALASTAAEAISACKTIVICIDNYAVTTALLNLCAKEVDLSGRTLIQLSTGSPNDGRQLAVWAKERGAEYLDGAIMAFPAQIDEGQGQVLVSGTESAYEQNLSLLKALTSDIRYISEDPGAASALDFSLLSFFYAGLLGAIQGVHLCEKEGVDMELVGNILSDFSPILASQGKRLAYVVREDKYNEPESSLRSYALAADSLALYAQKTRLDADIPNFAAKMMKKGVDAGFEMEELFSLIKVLRECA